uniref:Cytochrome P450 n=1 Tax=Chromera velia CCMP2878 TaxID=1169474 RepID=A0A0G4I6W2_9ALVE|eukprot:Cvel_11530.t1-p1 / transcript=Cvel_11530.t1 / gene=Cvel_11530 / organism=Chromera_velia_CCMP2878 / gene_product=Cytochrome P450 3A5, putative / transcript_product=Cytochrome P450 3A5, putative / location=Cvel_scaffold727:46038-50409(-) / protein_length=634 / sequence_SO=supercontig / SO=protein_coding / is_pseudo=false
MILLLGGAATAAAAVLALSYLSKRRRGKDETRGKEPPLAPGRAGSGLRNVYYILTGRLHTLVEEVSRFQTICTFPLMWPFGCWCVVAEPKYYKQLLGNDGLPKYRPYKDSLEKLLLGKQNLLTAIHTNALWRGARKGISAGFSVNAIVSKSDQIETKIRELCESLKEGRGLRKGPDGQMAVDLDEWFIRWAIDILGVVTLNVDFNCLAADPEKGPEGELLYEGIPKALKEVGVFHFFLPFRKHLSFLFPEVRQAWETVEAFRRLCHNILEKGRKSGVVDTAEHSLIAEILRVDYGDEAFRAAEVMAFLFAGHDTTGHTMAWTAAGILGNDRIKRRLQKELDEVMGDREIPTYSDLQRMPYLQACVHEAMRKWPVVNSGTIRTTRTEPVKVGEYVIPPNTPVIVPFGVIFNDKRWGDPENFRPERFLSEEEEEEEQETEGKGAAGEKRGEEDELERADRSMKTMGMAFANASPIPVGGDADDWQAEERWKAWEREQKRLNSVSDSSPLSGECLEEVERQTGTLAGGVSTCDASQLAEGERLRASSADLSGGSGEKEGSVKVDEEFVSQAFVPFSFGPRNCAGQTLAKIGSRLVLAALFKKFDFEPVHLPKDGKWFITFAPKGGVRVRVKERKPAV